MGIDVLTVSSKGQVVIPAEMRKKLSIESGSKLAAYVSGDVIMLMPIVVPTEQDFADRLDEAKEWAASVGYVESDVADIIKDVRRKKHA